MSLLKALLRNALTALLALLLLFEEWGWEPLARALAWLGRLRLVARVERKIQRLPPWAALLVFALPLLLLFPVKLLALYLFGIGQALPGLALLAGAKLVGTAMVARLFQLTQPALMQFAWFARNYPRWKNWKDGVMAQVRASALWQRGRRIRARVRAWRASW